MQQEGLQADKLTWNSLISGYAQHDCGHISLQLFRQMQMEGTEPDMVTFMSVLKACSIAVLDQARFMHSQMVETGLHSAVWIGSNLIDMYAKCGDLQAAVGVFDRLTQKDLVSWNAIIAAHVNHACSQEVFQLFQRMQDEGMTPHQVTFVLMLKACSSRGALYEGKLLYSYIIESHCELDVFVGTALIDLYMKCGSLEDACVVFNKLPKRGVVTWSALVAGYAWHGYTGESSWLLQQMQQEGIKPTVVTWNGVIRGCAYNGLCSEALRNFQQMLLEGFEPNEASLVGVLSACSGFGDLIQGEVMHAYIIEGGWENNLNAGSALISMYANLGCLRASNWIFDGLSKQEVLVWSAMIEAFAQHGHYQEAMQLFQGMQQEGEVPNQVILTCILKACVNTTMLYQSKMAHVLALELGFESNMLVGHSLINVYTKCGNLEDAWSVFYKLQDRDEVTWSAMIEGFAEHGDYKSALHCFQGMQGEDLNPNSVTFLSLLSACSHAGLVQEACHYFNLMQNTYCVAPTFTHYNCMADLLGRAGRLVEANDLLQTMPYRPTFVGHLCLLNHCKTYGNFSIGKKYFNLTYHVTSRHSASYDFMAEIYAHAGNWEASDSLKKLKKCANAWKKPGGAHVEFDNNVQFFTVGERRHPQTREILATLKKLGGQLEEEGYVPHLDLMSDKEGAYCTEAF